METIYLDDFLDEGIIREKSFRQKVSEINWDDYNAKRVMIKDVLPFQFQRGPI